MWRKIIVFCFVLMIAGLAHAEKPANYIMHKVASGESLYKISQKYHVTVEDILKLNAGVTAANLKPGMILRVPGKNTHATTVKPPTAVKKQQTHIVLPKETLYSISKKYAVTVDQIKTWNDLGDNAIKEGAVLVLFPEVKPVNPEPVKAPEEKPIVITPTKPEIPIKEELPGDAQPEENLTITALSKKFLAQQQNGVLQTVKGTAALMASSSPSSSNTYFAMHKTAPVGTVLKIKNLENNKVTYVKVIGKLPDLDENKNVMVRISMGAAKLLLMGYGKAYVEMSFVQ